MVGKTYLGYQPSAKGGVVVSRQAQSIFCSTPDPTAVPPAPVATTTQAARGRGTHSGGRGAARGGQVKQAQQEQGKVLVVAPMLEGVGITNLRTGQVEQTLVAKELLTALGRAPPEVTVFTTPQQQGGTNAGLGATQYIGKAPIAVGYSNGHVTLFQVEPTGSFAGRGGGGSQGNKYQCVFTALGHKLDTGVLSLAMDNSATVMVSGGQDTDVTVWDVTAQEPSFRLRGHRGGVVALKFVTTAAPIGAEAEGETSGSTLNTGTATTRFVASAGADGLIKVWDLHVQQCLQTIIASDSQVTSMSVDPWGQRLMVGLRENMVKVFSTAGAATVAAVPNLALPAKKEDEDESPPTAGGAAVLPPAGVDADTLLFEHGVLGRKSAKAATGVVFSQDASFLAVVSATNVEIFQVHSADVVKKKAKRRQKRKRDDIQPRDGELDNAAEKEAGAAAVDEISPLRIFHFDRKIRSVTFVPETSNSLKTKSAQQEDDDDEDDEKVHFLVAFSDNHVETYEARVTLTGETGAAVSTLTDKKLKHQLNSGAHSADIKGLKLTSDDMRMVSMSEESIKVWRLKKNSNKGSSYGDDYGFDDEEDGGDLLSGGGSISELVPLVSVPVMSDPTTQCEATCFEILPGNNLVAVGTSSGQLLILSLSSTQPVFSTSAHVGTIACLHLKFDGSGLLTVGTDRRVCHWELALTGEGPEDVALELVTDAELTHPPLYITTSADGKLCGIALQDNNIQVLFLDTMKPFHVLYGHKLPVTCFSFSVDGTLIASVGIDKSLRFWGTDYGDCHKAIHAHDDYITSVGFVSQTHYVFTASLDGTIKHWDGDNWTLIQRFHIHQHGIWSLTSSSDGGFVVTAGADRCIRTLMRTESIIFPHEEDEKMAQEAMDYENVKRDAMNRLEYKGTDVGVAGQKTVSSNEAAEALMTAMDRVSVELQRLSAKKKGETAGEPSIYFRSGRTVWQYLWSVIESIKPSEMRHALSALTSVHAGVLLEYLEKMIDNNAVLNYEWAVKVLLPLVKPAPGSNSHVILSFSDSSAGLIQLHRVRQKLTNGLQKEADRNGFNTAALGLVRRKLEEEKKVKFFDLSKVQGHKKKYHSASL